MFRLADCCDANQTSEKITDISRLREGGGNMEMNTMADWEEWVKLAREDPEEFERERKAAIEELIMGQLPQTRQSSRQLQWKIDAIRRTSPNSLSACIRIYDMLMDSVYGPNGLLEALNRLGNVSGAIGRDHIAAKKTGLYLKFKRKKSTKLGDSGT
jgi:hypothetical protein